MKKLFTEGYKKTKDVAKKASNNNEKKMKTSFSNTDQQIEHEMQDQYDDLKSIQLQSKNEALARVEEFNSMMGPQKMQLTDEEMYQMRQNYFDSKACKSILNFYGEITFLISAHKMTAPKEVLTAAEQLKTALTNSIKTGWEDYLKNQTEFEVVQKNLFTNSQRLINQYSPAIEEDPSFFASLIRVFNYLFGCCLGKEIATSTVFSESARYKNSKFSLFHPVVNENEIVDNLSSQFNGPK